MFLIVFRVFMICARRGVESDVEGLYLSKDKSDSWIDRRAPPYVQTRATSSAEEPREKHAAIKQVVNNELGGDKSAI